MNKFFADTWNELRSRRLWPVALLLVAALVAVPVLLRKSPTSSSSSSSSTPAPSTSSPATDAKPVVVATSDVSAGGSKLNMFNSKNPFKPHLPKVKAASTGTTGASGSSSSSSSSQSSGSGSGSAGTGGTGSGSGTTTQPKGPFAYVVDVKFGKRDQTKVHHNVQKLDVLPNANNPLLVFMGVNTAGDTAVFLTDTSLKASGEGTCKPSSDVCSFLYLKLDKQSDTEDLLAENPDGTGVEYTLKLLDIKKVPVSELAKASKSAKSSKRAAAAVGDKRSKPATPFHWLFKLPQLPDEVSG